MSVDRILQKYTTPAHVPDAVGTSDPADEALDLGCYGLLRGIRDRALALELRKKDDTVLAVPYALIEQFLYAPGEGITLRAGGREVRLRGRNLCQRDATRCLFSALVRHRVPWVAEQSRAGGPAESTAAVVESIHW